MQLLCDLLKSSVSAQEQIIQSKGFLIISVLLEKVMEDLFIFLVYDIAFHITLFYSFCG